MSKFDEAVDRLCEDIFSAAEEEFLHRAMMNSAEAEARAQETESDDGSDWF
jgi:hypothetical protein